MVKYINIEKLSQQQEQTMEYDIERQDVSQIRIPPNDQNAELLFLGCMLFDDEGLMDGVRLLKEDDFYRPNNRAIFSAMNELNRQSSPVDIVTLSNILKKRGEFEIIGEMPYLISISNSVSTSANIEVYAKIIEEKSILRKLIKVSGEVQNASFLGNEEIDSIIDKAEKGIFDIVQNRKTTDFYKVSDLVGLSIEKLEELYRNKGESTGLPTGFYDFDIKTAGLQKADLILIAARPSMGKTAFALNILQYIAIHQKKSVAVFSLEMSRDSLVNRMLSSEANVLSSRMRTGDLEPEDWEKLGYAIPTLSEANIYIDDTPGISVNEVRSKARKLKIEKGLDLIVIDYLQLMNGSGRNESRQQEVSDISRGLKAIARELDVPVVALSQLSRANEKRPDKRPMLSDLRDSGAIEQDADLVCFIHREEYYTPDTEDKGISEIIIAKQRNGETGTVKLGWLGEYTRFYNIDRKYE